MREPKQRASQANAPAKAAGTARPRNARGCFIAKDGVVAARPRARKRKTPLKPLPWSVKRERAFLSALAETCNVAASVRAARVSETTVYRKRRQSEAFRDAWAAALREGVDKLEMLLLDRAMNGVQKPVWHGGKQVGTMTEYSDRLALALLGFHRGGAGRGVGAREAAPEMSDAERRAELKAKLSEMNKRMGGAG